MNDKILVTCGLPYVNGPCHIGHLRTYIPADIFVRYLRKLRKEIVFVCGSDVYGTPIALDAERQGMKPEDLADKYHHHYLEIFDKLGVKFDSYGRTDSVTNRNRTSEIVSRLMARGHIYPKQIETAYCGNCKRFLPDRYVEGTCPYCGAKARGDECDQGCGKHLEPGELKEPICKICGNLAEQKEQIHYFFRLSEFQSHLEDHLSNLEGTSNARNYAKEWVRHGLRDWCITRNLSWGVPFSGNENLVVYVWVDAPIGYISFTEDCREDWEEFWRDGRKVIHFIGGDIIYHHCIFWPAMLKGAGYSLPDAVVASGMVKIEGKKFSKSRGQVIWAEDFLGKYHPDLLRYYLVRYTSHTKELNFSWDDFRERVNNELVGILGNFLYRTLSFAYKKFGIVPKGEIDPEVMRAIDDTREHIMDNLENYELKKSVDSPMQLAGFGNSYFQAGEPWHWIKRDKEKAGKLIRNSLQIIKALCIGLEPVMPVKMEGAWKQLGMGGDVHEVSLDDMTKEIPEGQGLREAKMLFKKV